MYAALKLTNVALALGIILFSFASNALVSPKEEVAEATQAWALALGEDEPDKACRSTPTMRSFGERCRRLCALIERHFETTS